MSSPPRFRRGDGGAPDRLNVVEEYLARKEEFDRQQSAAVEKGIADLDARLSKLEGWKVDVLVFIGATKIRLGAVVFVAASLASLLTLAAAKVLHL